MSQSEFEALQAIHQNEMNCGPLYSECEECGIEHDSGDDFCESCFDRMIANGELVAT